MQIRQSEITRNLQRKEIRYRENAKQSKCLQRKPDKDLAGNKKNPLDLGMFRQCPFSSLKLIQLNYKSKVKKMILLVLRTGLSGFAL